MSDLGLLATSTRQDHNRLCPELIGKYQKELTTYLGDHILASYAQGNAIEDVRRLLEDIYEMSIFEGRISQITVKVLPEIQERRSRGLISFYPVVYLYTIHFIVRQDGNYMNSAFHPVYSFD